MTLDDVVRERIVGLFKSCNSNAKEVYRRLVADDTDVSYTKVCTVLKSEGMELKQGPKCRGIKRIPERDVLAAGGGLSLQGIADRVGVKTGEAIRQYLKNTGQYDGYLAARKKRYDAVQKRLRLERASLRDHVRAASFALHFLYSEGFGWAGEKAFEYFCSRKFHRTTDVPFDSLVSLFEEYKMALDSGVQPSLYDLAESSGLKTAMIVKRILESVGLRSFNRLLRLSDEGRAAILRAYDLDLSQADIAYFVGCTYRNVNQHFAKLGKGRRLSECLAYFENNESLSYHVASMIYELFDECFSAEDTAGILKVPENVVRYALDNRAEGDCIEKKLVSALRAMFPERDITKPYLIS